MSGAGAPTIQIDGTGVKVTIVAGQWHEIIANGLLAGAHRALKEMNADVTEVRVPGSFELPVVSKAALENGADAVVALGVIIRGGTPHFHFVANSVTDGLTRVQLDTGRPVGFGVLTTDNDEQALDRSGLPGSRESKGVEAAEAALHSAVTVAAIRA